jgi:hypothetical protein
VPPNEIPGKIDRDQFAVGKHGIDMGPVNDRRGSSTPDTRIEEITRHRCFWSRNIRCPEKFSSFAVVAEDHLRFFIGTGQE